MGNLGNRVNASQHFKEVVTQKYEIYNTGHSREEYSNCSIEEIT